MIRIGEEIHFDGVIACQNGLAAKTNIDELSAAVKKDEFTVCINLNIGKGSYSLFTSDLSTEYVEFNREEYALNRKS